jgi:hypothetical protein
VAPVSAIAASLPRTARPPILAIATALLLVVLGLLITTKIPAGTPVAALMVTGVLVLGMWMLTSPRYHVTLAALMVYIALADGYLKLKTGSNLATLGRDVLLYSIAIGALARTSVSRDALKLPPLTGWVIAWIAVVAVQIFNPSNGTMVHSIVSVRPHVEWVPLFFLGYAVMRTKRRLQAFLLLLLAVAAVNGIVGLVQFNLSPEQLAAWGPGYEEKIMGSGDVAGRGFVDSEGTVRTRPFGLGSDMGFAGVLGLIAVPAALALLALPRAYGVRAMSIVLGIGCVLAVATSQARVAVIGAVIAAFAFAFLVATSRTGRRTLVALGVGCLLVYGTLSILAADTESGSFDRYSDISNPGQAVKTAYDYRKDTIALIPEYAIDFPLGAGLGSKGPAASLGGQGDRSEGLNAESQPTFLLIELGVPGLLVLLGFFLRLLSLSFTGIRRLGDRELKLLLTGVAAPLFALLATWIVGIGSATTPSSPYFWFAAGILAYWLGRQKPTMPSQPAALATGPSEEEPRSRYDVA